MAAPLLQLYPDYDVTTTLPGLYLGHRLHTLGNSNQPLVYANFLSSLDGRIALEDVADNSRPYIPEHLTTASDFRLFMELHAQADCLITHGGYMRALGEKRLGNILQVGDPDFSAWRHANGLPPQPAVVIASASLNFPIHPSLSEHRQDVYIATGKHADAERIRLWQRRGYRILITGEDRLVHGRALIRQLQGLGYRCIYLIAGPKMLDTVIRERQLNRLYLTITHQLLGGLDFRTLLTGPTLGGDGDLLLKSLYYQRDVPQGSGQFFLQFALRNVAQTACAPNLPEDIHATMGL